MSRAEELERKRGAGVTAAKLSWEVVVLLRYDNALSDQYVVDVHMPAASWRSLLPKSWRIWWGTGLPLIASTAAAMMARAQLSLSLMAMPAASSRRCSDCCGRIRMLVLVSHNIGDSKLQTPEHRARPRRTRLLTT